MIANIDDNVGRLLAKLKEWGLEHDTLVIFMNDNGGTAGVQRLQRRHARPEGHALAGRHAGGVVLALAGHAEAGRRGPALAAHIDFFPTLAEIAGAKLTDDVKAQVEGRSLVPLLAGPEGRLARPDALHARRPLAEGDEAGRVQVSPIAASAARAGTWSAQATRTARKHWQLFDVKADPGEKTDVAGQAPRGREGAGRGLRHLVGHRCNRGW